MKQLLPGIPSAVGYGCTCSTEANRLARRLSKPEIIDSRCPLHGEKDLPSVGDHVAIYVMISKLGMMWQRARVNSVRPKTGGINVSYLDKRTKRYAYASIARQHWKHLSACTLSSPTQTSSETPLGSSTLSQQ